MSAGAEAGLAARRHGPPPAARQLPRAERLGWLESIGYELLLALGEDPERDGLRDTPARWARAWLEFMDGRGDPLEVLDYATFALPEADQMVVVRGLRVWSLCEHHLLPFWCELTIGYIPHGKILGLSKFMRLARRAASRLQVQERLVEDIAGTLARLTESEDVAVLADGEHLCMLMRGVKAGHRMSTSVVRGAFRTASAAREELFHLARPRHDIT